MTGRDLLGFALGNLKRHRMRVTFTTAGVVIAIATFVALLSFAAGSQKWIDETYQQLGLLSTMTVKPREPERIAGRPQPPVLDAVAVRRLSQVPGVRVAFPFVDFEVQATVADTTVVTKARALAPEAFSTTMFTRALGGESFTSSDAHEAIVTREFAKSVGVGDPDSLVGLRLVIAMRVASLDSALLNVAGPRGRTLIERLKRVDVDSLRALNYRRRLMRRELNEGVGRFASGLVNRQLTVAETLAIRGVGEDMRQYNLRLTPVLIPEGTARRLAGAGMSLSGDPAALLSAVRGGTLFSPAGAESSRTYPQVTLDLQPLANPSAVKDSVEALGYDAFSFAEQFKEVQRFHVYFYSGLGVVGLLALLTAALGIVNTLVMSVTERRREIGVLKSLGADESTIRALFLAESALIGALGSGVGLVLGWAGTRVASVVIRGIMAREEFPPYEPFVLPPWLVLLAIGFGIGVSMLAGTFPAARAAAVDPVEALRSD